MDAPARHSFGPFRLDTQHRRLERDGVAVPLSSRAFDILQVLVEERGRVLSRAEIMARVWPGLAVEEHNLSVQMSKLRRALGDTGDEAAVIATLPGRGYRFVATVDAQRPPDAATRSPAPPEPLPGNASPGSHIGSPRRATQRHQHRPAAPPLRLAQDR